MVDLRKPNVQAQKMQGKVSRICDNRDYELTEPLTIEGGSVPKGSRLSALCQRGGCWMETTFVDDLIKRQILIPCKLKKR